MNRDLDPATARVLLRIVACIRERFSSPKVADEFSAKERVLRAIGRARHRRLNLPVGR